MLMNLRRSIISVVVFTVFFGFVYSLAGTGVAQILFPHQADGSIITGGLDPHRPELGGDKVRRPPVGQLRVPRPSRRYRALCRKPEGKHFRW